jgi:predicted TIM-barrel fold metal-dependent hydrolase
MVIDTHVHVYDEGFWSARWFDYVAYRWAKTPPLDRDASAIRDRIEPGMVDADGDRIVADMDAAGIDRAVILPLDWELGLREKPGVGIEEVHRRYAAMVKRQGGRLLVFAGIDPQRPEAVRLFEWAVAELGVSGLKLYPPTGFYPYHRCVYPLYERCEASGLPVFCHTGGTIALLRPRFANPLYLQDVQADFPRMKLWLGHSGALWWWEEAVGVVVNGVNSYLELSGWEELAYREEEVFIRQLAKARDRIGAHRMVFGSDHFSGPKFRGRASLARWTQWFRELPERARRLGVGFSHEEVELILGGNAARCLGLKED